MKVIEVDKSAGVLFGKIPEAFKGLHKILKVAISVHKWLKVFLRHLKVPQSLFKIPNMAISG